MKTSLALTGSGVPKADLIEALKTVLKDGVNAEGLETATKRFKDLGADPKATADQKKFSDAMAPYLEGLKDQLKKEGEAGIPKGFARNCVLDTEKLLQAPGLPRLSK